MTASNGIKVLLVEDNEGDVFLFREAMQGLGLPMHVKVAPDGQAAMNYLRRPDATPDVVILDLNLPRKSGREVLEEMSCDPNLRGMPVAILSTWTSQSDVVLREIKQNCVFFSKTADMTAFRKIVTEIHQLALSPRPN